jgi:membrane dipeptidase
MTTPQAARVLRHATVCDMTYPWSFAKNDHEIFPRYRAAGFDLISATAMQDVNSTADAYANIALLRQRVLASPDRFRLVERAEDIAGAKKAGKLAVVVNAQGTAWIGSDLGHLESMYRLGLRQMLLAYQLRNKVADGCGERTDAGLSRFGVRLINEMNRVGIIVDCSHTGYQSSMEALEVSTAPCIFSHSNAKKVYDHYRNITDDQIIACAKTGGVIGALGMGVFVSAEGATVATIFHHIDYIVNLVGDQHVGLGFDHVADPQGLADWTLRHEIMWPPNRGQPGAGLSNFFQPEQIEELAGEMLKHNYSEASVSAILGENFVRVAAAVWK